jgi:saccharopine dehydrogenase (NADP+, L-glutamate forming)/spermidine synthase
VAECNLDKEESVRNLVSQADVAVSLLPAPRHPQIARACLDCGRHMVTTSYVSPAMRAFDAEARKKDLLLLNEIGVDPGIDHMSAMRVIHQEEKKGGSLTGFSSWCGGLPAPEADDNPFRYKFSWAPRGVLVAAKNNAKYLKDGKSIEIPGSRLFSEPAQVEIPGLGQFEGYPNRDSISYIETYHLGKEVQNMFRGTLRYPGHCRLYTNLIRLGLLDEEKTYDFRGQTYLGLMEQLFGAPVQKTIPAKLGVDEAASPLLALEYIGLFQKTEIKLEKGVLLDLLAERMTAHLQYKPGERDMLIMRHDLAFSYDKGQRKERITAVLKDFGIPQGDTSMARTVSLPAAIAVRMLLEGKIAQRGVVIPVMPSLYEPILDELESMTIGFTETRNRIS